MTTNDLLKTIALASVLASAPPLLVLAAWGEPAAQPKTEQPKEVQAQKPAKSPAVDQGADDLSLPAAGATGKATAAAAAKDVSVGAVVFTSDGKKIGQIKGVKSEASGVVQEIHVDTGTKTVVVPGAKIAKTGQNVQLAMTSAEVDKLPSVAERKG